MRNLSRVVLTAALLLYVVAAVVLVLGGRPIPLVVAAFAVTMVGLVLAVHSRRQGPGAARSASTRLT